MNEEQKALWAALAAPFHANEIKQRQIPGGGMVDYVTSETIENRLDSVLGPGGWRDAYRVQPVRIGDKTKDVAVCRLEVNVPDPEGDYWVGKEGVGAIPEMTNRGGEVQEESTAKGHFSDAFKRAARKFGIARYLGGDGIPDYAEDVFRAAGVPFRPPAEQRAGGSRGGQDGPPRAPGGHPGGAPRTGGALFAWSKKQEEALGWESGVFIRYLQDWGTEQEFPERIVDWDAEQVAAGYAEGLATVERSRRGEPA